LVTTKIASHDGRQRNARGRLDQFVAINVMSSYTLFKGGARKFHFSALQLMLGFY
jgi:hypothetical protein